MAGELLIRVVDYDKFKALAAGGDVTSVWGAADAAFLDGGRWSFVEPSGTGFVVIDGSAFFEEMGALYEGHHDWPALIEGEETETLMVPNEVLAIWQGLLARLPPQGLVRTEQPKVATVLAGLIEMALGEQRLRLTVASML
jgi:hypothetical protein